jgi:hypothetical protein
MLYKHSARTDAREIISLNEEKSARLILCSTGQTGRGEKNLKNFEPLDRFGCLIYWSRDYDRKKRTF